MDSLARTVSGGAGSASSAVSCGVPAVPDEAAPAHVIFTAISFEANPLPAWIFDRQTLAVLAVNEAAVQHYGYPREEFLALSVRDLRPPEEVPALLDAVARVPHTGTTPSTWRHRTKDGTVIDVEAYWQHLRFHERDAVLVFAQDITDQRRLEASERLLLEAGEVLATSLDVETTLASLVSLAVPRLADWSVAYLLGNEGTVERIEVAHADPQKAAWARALHQQYPADPNARTGLLRLMSTNQPTLYREVSDDLLGHAARDTQHLALLRQLGLTSALVVPMQARGRILGAITLAAAESRRSYEAADLALAEDLARRAALAIENARLYERAQRELVERERVEVALRASEARYRTLFEGIADAILVSDETGRLVDANPAATHLLGYSRAELRALTPGGFLDDPASLRVAFECLRGEGTWRGEVNVRRKDGTVVPAETWACRVLLPTGPALLGVLRDLTARRQAEAARHERNRALRRLADANLIGIITGEQERIVEANDRFLAMTGYTRAEVEQGHLNWRAMTPPDYASLDERALRELQSQGTCVPFEKEYLRKDGTRVPVLLGAALLEPEPLRWVCYVVDLSEQRALEQAQQTFLADLSHDLKNPLTAMRGQLQLLQRRVRRRRVDAEALMDGLTTMADQIERLFARIDEVADMARLRLGEGLELQRAPCDLVTLAQHAAETYQQTTDRHTIGVEAAQPRLVGVWDSARLERVLDNLLSNAIKYSPNGGPITLTVVAEPTVDGTWAMLAVQDDGVGIGVADQAAIFERFRRGGNVAGRIRGTGIGLAGVKAIIEQHGGTISVASREGHGSTFTVRLPLDVREAAEPRQVAEQALEEDQLQSQSDPFE